MWVELGVTTCHIPILGITIPIMRTHQAVPAGILAALLSPVQARILAILFTKPDRQFQSAELIRLVGAGTGATHRQLHRMTQSGLLKSVPLGSQTFYQANRDSLIFAEIHSMVLKTIGLAEPLREALAPIQLAIAAAFVFGSIATGTATAESDVDLMILSDTLRYPDLFEALQPAEALLSRRINPTVMSRVEWRQKIADPESFAAQVTNGPTIEVIRARDDLP